MSRLFTCGFETGYGGTQAAALAAEDSTITETGSGMTVASNTSIVRSGARALKISGGTTGSAAQYNVPFTIVVSRNYFGRICLYVESFGGGAQNFWPAGFNDGTHGMELMVTPSGVLTLANASNDALVVAGGTLVTGQWYVLEWSYVPNTGAAQLWVDGVSKGTGTAETSALTAFSYTLEYGWSATGGTVDFDDWALNDNQGASQNGRCGNTSKIVLLKPTADSAGTGFSVSHAGDTLWASVANTPPLGTIATDTTTVNSKIKDATSSTTDNYQPSLGAYTTAVASGGGGLASNDRVDLVQGICNHGSSTVTSRTNGLQVVSNPAVGETTGATGTTAAATFPTGWTALKTAVSLLPSVTLAAAPVVEFRKGTASADSAMADLIGLYVEYTPGAGGTIHTDTPDGQLILAGSVAESYTLGDQLLRPASDIATTGWTTTPLFSKINDSSDGTFITATLA